MNRSAGVGGGSVERSNGLDTALYKNKPLPSFTLELHIVLQVTVVDFPIYELLFKLVILEPKCLDDLPKLKAFIDRFEVCHVEEMGHDSTVHSRTSGPGF